MINVRTRQLIKYVLMLETLPLAGDEYHDLIASNGGVVEKTDRWGERKMPYVIQDYENGIYVLVTFHASKRCVLELHKAMEITEEVLRHMIIRKGVC